MAAIRENSCRYVERDILIFSFFRTFCIYRSQQSLYDTDEGEKRMNRFRSIKIRGYKRLESGIFLEGGRKWVILKENPMDFIIDGYLFIRKKHILRQESSDGYELMDVIMRLKGEYSKAPDFFDLNLNNDELLFKHFSDNKYLIQICLHNQDSTLVGQILLVEKDSFRMKLLSRKGKWLKEFNFKYDKLRTVSVGSDYLKSLELLIKENKI